MSHSQPDLLSASDEELLSYFKNGQNEALVALLTRRKTWLWNVAKKSIRDRSLAEDALQEALVSIWKSAHTFRGNLRFPLGCTKLSPGHVLISCVKSKFDHMLASQI